MTSLRTVVIAMDGSAHSEYAFQCKFFFFWYKYIILKPLRKQALIQIAKTLQYICTKEKLLSNTVEIQKLCHSVYDYL